jgi:hypothetical protein
MTPRERSAVHFSGNNYYFTLGVDQNDLFVVFRSTELQEDRDLGLLWWSLLAGVGLTIIGDRFADLLQRRAER